MIHQMTSLEEKVWAHVFALEYRVQSQEPATLRIEDAREAERVADTAVTNLRKLRENGDQTTITFG